MALEHLQMKMGDVGKNQEKKKRTFHFQKSLIYKFQSLTVRHKTCTNRQPITRAIS